LTNTEVLDEIKRGHRLSFDDTRCPAELAQAVRDECWAEDPEKRWGFVELLKFLQNLLDDADGAMSDDARSARSARSVTTVSTTPRDDIYSKTPLAHSLAVSYASLPREDVYTKTPLARSEGVSYESLPSGTDLAGSADIYSKTPRSRKSSDIKVVSSDPDSPNRSDSSSPERSNSDQSSSDSDSSSVW
jgi:hypothetical protein